MATNSFLQQLMGNGRQPTYTQPTAGLILDAEGRVSVDPTTGLNIPKKDRRKAGAFAANPMGITPGNALNFNVPQWTPTGATGGGLGANLMKILGGAK